MKIQCKIFLKNTPEELEKELNEFLKDNWMWGQAEN